jgi:hypothetical protein
MLILHRIDPPGPIAIKTDTITQVRPIDEKDFSQGSWVNVGSGIIKVKENFHTIAEFVGQSSSRYAILKLAQVINEKSFRNR